MRLSRAARIVAIGIAISAIPDDRSPGIGDREQVIVSTNREGRPHGMDPARR